MGIHDTLLNSEVGQCSTCNEHYVVFSEILANDSHVRVYENYGRPICKSDSPKSIKRAEGDDFTFSKKQLQNRLYALRQNNHGLYIISSKEDWFNITL